MGENQRGIEWVGHDRGSVDRAAISIFSVEESPGSHNFLDTPGVYGHATHEWHFEGYGLSALQLGVFGARTTWPTTALTSGGTPIPGTGGALKPSTKIGGQADLWFNSTTTPLHAILVYAHGKDDQALIPDATRDGTFNGGFLEPRATSAGTSTRESRSGTAPFRGGCWASTWRWARGWSTTWSSTGATRGDGQRRSRRRARRRGRS